MVSCRAESPGVTGELLGPCGESPNGKSPAWRKLSGKLVGTRVEEVGCIKGSEADKGVDTSGT